MTQYEGIGDLERSPGSAQARSANTRRWAALRFCPKWARDRLIYGLAFLTFVVAPFGLMFVAAPVAVAYILINRPDGNAVVPSEANELYRLRHLPWSTTGLRRQP